MQVFETIMCALLVAFAVFLVVAVLMQHGKDHHLSGTIAGGAENFFGKTKGKEIDKVLPRITTIVSIVFVVILIIVFVIQPDIVYTTSAAENAPGALSPYYDAEVIYPAETEDADHTHDGADTTAAE